MRPIVVIIVVNLVVETLQRYRLLGSGWGDLVALTHFLDTSRALPVLSRVNGGRMAITQ